jgi:uncharacterized protein YeeX (DUF496 family)
MTDRYNALTVVLEENIREDDAEALIAAIRQLRGVQDVVPNVADINSVVADSRARLELLDALIQLVRKDRS